jgi:hypothetical protein
MSVCCQKLYDPKRLFECCNDSACTRIEVKKGQKGKVQIFEAPDCFMFLFHKLVWDKCCKKPQKYCETDHCGNPICVKAGTSVSDLSPGDYEITICGPDGPTVPDDGEVVVLFTQEPS